MTRWMRTSEAAIMLGVSESTVRRMAEAGLIPTRRRLTPGEWRLYERAAVEELAGVNDIRVEHDNAATVKAE